MRPPTAQQPDDAVHENPGVVVNSATGIPTGDNLGISGPGVIIDSKVKEPPKDSLPEHLGPEHNQVG